MSDELKQVNVVRLMLRARDELPDISAEMDEAIRAVGYMFAAARFTRDFILTADNRNFGADLMAGQLSDALVRCGANR